MNKTKEYLWLGVILLIGVALRLYLILGSQRMIDSDQAIFGLMARHLLYNGKFHVFYYGQPYMGSLLAVLTAPVFFFFGPSIFTLRVVSFTASILSIYFIYLVAKRIFSEEAALIAASILSVAPFAIARLGVSAEGNIEMLLLGLVSLNLFFKIYLRPAEETRNPRLYGWLGFFLGLAFWANLGIISILLTIMLYLVISEKGKIFKKPFLIMATFFVLGSFPLLIFNLKHRGLTFRFLLEGTTTSSMSEKISGLALHTNRFLTELLPLTFGAQHKIQLINIFIYGIYVFAFFFALIAGWTTWGKSTLLKSDGFKGMRVLVVLALINILFYVGTKFGAGGAPRYILSLYAALVMFVGFLLAHLRRYSKMVSYSLLVIILISNIFGNLVVKGESTDLIQLISFLESHNLKYVYSGYWTSYRLAFVSEEQVISSPQLDEVVIDRYPEYTEAIQLASVRRLAYVFWPNAPMKIAFERALQKRQLSYSYGVVGGYDVYYSLSQRIDPNELQR